MLGPCRWLRLAPGVVGATEQLGKQGADPHGHSPSLVGLWPEEGAVCTLPRRRGGAVRGAGPCVPELEAPPPACPPGGRGRSVFPCTPDIGGSLASGSPRPPQTRCVPPTPGPTGVWSRTCVPEPGACPGCEPGDRFTVSGLRLRVRPVPCVLPIPTWLLGTSLCPTGALPGTSQGDDGSDHRLGWWAGRCGCLPQRLETSKAVPGSLELLGVKGELGSQGLAASRLEEGALGLRCCWQSGRVWRGSRQVDHGRARGPGGHGPEKPAVRPVGADPECLRKALLPGSGPSATAPPSTPCSRAPGARITTASLTPLGCRQPPTPGRRTGAVGGGGTCPASELLPEGPSWAGSPGWVSCPQSPGCTGPGQGALGREP